MMTLLLEIKNKNSNNIGFYNPAVDGFKIGCRSWESVIKNIEKLVKLALKSPFVDDFRILLYDGKYEWYKKTELLEIYDKDRLQKMEILKICYNRRI